MNLDCSKLIALMVEDDHQVIEVKQGTYGGVSG
jgi:hypothetical protein